MWNLSLLRYLILSIQHLILHNVNKHASLKNLSNKEAKFQFKLKVSATFQDRPHVDCCSISCFYETHINHIFFKSLIIPDYGFELTKTIYLNVFRNWNALCKSTRLYRLVRFELQVGSLSINLAKIWPE